MGRQKYIWLKILPIYIYNRSVYLINDCHGNHQPTIIVLCEKNDVNDMGQLHVGFQIEGFEPSQMYVFTNKIGIHID